MQKMKTNFKYIAIASKIDKTDHVLESDSIKEIVIWMKPFIEKNYNVNISKQTAIKELD